MHCSHNFLFVQRQHLHPSATSTTFNMVGSMHSVSSFVGGLSTVVTEYFECDYEKDCTPLYKAIETAIVQEEEDYEHIANFLDTGLWPHEEAGDVASTSAEIQAKTWVTRFNPKDKEKVEWSQLPLHLAIVGGCPSNIIGGLVKLYPQGLRCTDDQQMLPLHLALRHGADDEIVAYLLMQFPDAVNARGKNDRTAVDCALRARDKLRGIILETFVEKTKIKMENYFLREKEEVLALFNDTSCKLDKVSADYSTKDAALTELVKNHASVASELNALKEAKEKMEADMKTKIEELIAEKAELEESTKVTIEKLTNQKLTESIELQKQINELSEEKSSVEEQINVARELEMSSRATLDNVQRTLEATVSMEDLDAIKQEIDMSQAYHLTKTKSQTRDTIISLKSDIERTIVASSTSDANELKTINSIKRSVSEIETKEAKATTSDEVLVLQSEVEKLRSELRQRNESIRTLSDLATLRSAMIVESKKKDIHSELQISAITAAIAATEPTTSWAVKPLAELVAIKNEVQKLHLELKENELARKTVTSIEELERELDSTMSVASPALKAELATLKPAVANLRKFIANSKSQNDVIGVAKDVESLKDLLRKKQTKSNLQMEANIINETVNTALVNTTGEAQKKELLQMKETVKSLSTSAVDNKNLEELEQLKSELSVVKKQLKDVEEATKLHHELESLKKTVETELLKANEKASKDLTEMKRAVDAVNMEQMESKSLKEVLAAEIAKASGQTEKELIALKEKVGAININDIESKNKDEWQNIRNDLETLKEDLREKQLLKLEDTDKELAKVRSTISQINEEQEYKNNSKFEELRKEMFALREDLAPKPKEKRRGLGLMKLFTSRLRRSSVSRAKVSAKVDGKSDTPVVEPEVEPDDVAKILPPSVSNSAEPQMKKNDANTYSEDNSSDDETGAPPAVKAKRSNENRTIITSTSKEMEVTLALHRNYSYASDQEKLKQDKVNAAAVQALPSFSSNSRAAYSQKKMLPSAMRRVRSMDPNAKSVTIDPYEIVRSWSKATIQPTGEVELEPVIEEQ